jgi:CDP-6-deoxy-D-xylo-4-hexulose-3-dehydrase
MNRIPLNKSTFGDEEINAVLNVLKSTRVTMGERCQQFEKTFGAYLGSGTEAIFVNSGSSANLMGFFAFANHDLPRAQGRRQLIPGSEVIVPAVSWSTTFWPIVQAGGIPVLVDSDPRTLQMKPVAMTAALTEKTVAVCPVHVLGNAAPMDEVVRFADDNNLWIIEDTCEALGTRYRGQLSGTFGHIATFSFFFSHHITTIEGGMIVTRDPQLAELLRCMRAHGWTRDLRKRRELEAQYPEINANFLFVNMGFNVRPTEINAAFGIIQLTKLEQFNRRRNEISSSWTQSFQPLIKQGIFQPMQPSSNADPAWFGYPVICRTPEIRKNLEHVLREHGIETRPIICGNMARQPALKHIRHRISGNLEGADQIMDCGLLWGLHPMMSDEERDYVADAVLESAARL